MSKEVPILNDFRKARVDILSDTGASVQHLFSVPGASQSPQILHKIRRIISEIRYAENNRTKFNLLTKREMEIIRLIVAGWNNPQISKQLFISRRTVEQHRKNINRKLEMHSLPEIYVFAYAFNLV